MESTFLPAFSVGVTIVAVIIALGAAFIVVSTVRDIITVRASGHDPMTLQTDLAVTLFESGAVAPDRPRLQRFVDLDALLAAGTISTEEHSAARVRLLGSVCSELPRCGPLRSVRARESVVARILSMTKKRNAYDPISW